MNDEERKVAIKYDAEALAKLILDIYLEQKDYRGGAEAAVIV
ncbi:MAG: hypothetical protein WBB94_04610 [Candidatus Saccharimonadaceae bacterium]